MRGYDDTTGDGGAPSDGTHRWTDDADDEGPSLRPGYDADDKHDADECRTDSDDGDDEPEPLPVHGGGGGGCGTYDVFLLPCFSFFLLPL